MVPLVDGPTRVGFLWTYCEDSGDMMSDESRSLGDSGSESIMNHAAC